MRQDLGTLHMRNEVWSENSKRLGEDEKATHWEVGGRSESASDRLLLDLVLALWLTIHFNRKVVLQTSGEDPGSGPGAAPDPKTRTISLN